MEETERAEEAFSYCFGREGGREGGRGRERH